MSAHFLAEDTFHLQNRGLFVAHGKVVDGSVGRGQVVVAPHGLDARVDAIEVVLLSATEARENVALCFRYRDEAELGRWQALALVGQTLELAHVVPG